MTLGGKRCDRFCFAGECLSISFGHAHEALDLVVERGQD